MKNLATLKNMNGAIWQAKNAYLKAVADNLKETGELKVISEDYDEDLGYPEGILLSIPNKHFYMVDCVFNYIKASEKGAIEVHICYFDDHEEEGWMQANELSFNDLDAIIDAIQWPDTITNGEAETEQNEREYGKQINLDYDAGDHERHCNDYVKKSIRIFKYNNGDYGPVRKKINTL